MSHDWERFGKALQAAREAKGMAQTELGDAVGVSRSTVQAIERGKSFKKPTPTVRSLARAVGWTDDSVDTVLDGGEPTLAGAAPPPEAAPQTESGTPPPLRLIDATGNDAALVGTTRIPIPGGGSVTVTVEGDPAQSPRQRRKNLEAWRRIQDVLMEIDINGSPGTPDDPNGAAEEG